MKKRQLKRIRWALSLLVLALIFYFTESQELEQARPGAPPVLYASACNDNLEEVFVEAVKGAHESVHLVIYSLSDKKVIEALNAQASQGVSVSVIHDLSTPQTGFGKLMPAVANEGVKRSGLMHQKILVVDAEKVWIGSANMTTESLKFHDNLVIGVVDPKLAQGLLSGTPYIHLTCGGQSVEFWDFPQKGKEGLERLIALLDGARKTVKVAMFTWTHPRLTDAVIRAHMRGVNVEVIHDRGQAEGVSAKTVAALVDAGIDVRLSRGAALLHHKFAWIDGTTLISGSANWTLSAFSRNRDCFLILEPLTTEQQSKMSQLWKKTFQLSDKEDLPVFGEGPVRVRDDELERIDMAA